MKTIAADPFARYAPGATRHAERQPGTVDAVMLFCGILSAVIYPAADILAARRYPGFSYTDQAVSELFAIGAPTSTFVVPLFSLSTALLLPFALGIWRASAGRRVVRVLAVLLVLHAIDALLLWNFFPMHMRGVPMTSTDTMHGLLAIDPFLLALMIAGAVAFRGPFRRYTIVTIAFGFALATYSITFLSAVVVNAPTPYMGLAERGAHYANNLWFAVLAVMLLRRPGREASARRSS